MKMKKIIITIFIAFITLTFNSAVYAEDWISDLYWENNGGVETSCAFIANNPGDYLVSLENQDVNNLNGEERKWYIAALNAYLGSNKIVDEETFKAYDKPALEAKLKEVKSLDNLTEEEKNSIQEAENESQKTNDRVGEKEIGDELLEGAETYEEAKENVENELGIAIEDDEGEKVIYHDPSISSTDKKDTAEKSIDDMISDADKFIKDVDSSQLPIDSGTMKNFSNTFYNILLALGIVVAVVMGMIMGIKFMMGSAEEKADIKTMLIPYVIGCIVVFAGFGIWKAVIVILQSV